MRFSIDQKVLESLLSYVAARPYNEVAQIIQVVQQDIKPIEEVQEVPRRKSQDTMQDTAQAFQEVVEQQRNKVRAFPQVQPPTEVIK